MAVLTELQIDTLARGIIGAMTAVSQVHQSKLADTWESERAKAVVRKLEHKAPDGSSMQLVLEQAAALWPGTVQSLSGTSAVLGIERAIIAVEAATTTAAAVLQGDDARNYRGIVVNIATATGEAASEDGLFFIGKDRLSVDESAMVDRIDALFG